MPESVLDWGIGLILQLQAAIGEGAIPIMNFFTSLGYEEFFLIFLPVVYWCYDAGLGVRVGIGLFTSIALNDMLKMAFNDPRPYWYDTRVKLLADPETSFGIPSGHAQNAVVLWSVLAAHVRKRWAWVVAILLAFLIGFSRIYLGAHFPTDVIAGWLFGAILLVLILRFGKPVAEAFGKYAPPMKYGILLALAAAFIIATAVELRVIEGVFEAPAEWNANAVAANPEASIHPLTITTIITTMGVLCGLAAGAVWIGGRGGFDAGGLFWKRAARYLLGLVVAVVIWLGLDLVFAQIAVDESLPGYVLRFVRYGLVGFWVGGFAPAVFVRLKLAEKAKGMAAS